MPKSNVASTAYAVDLARARWSSGRGWHSRILQILWLWRERGARYVLRRALLRLGKKTRSYKEWIAANDTLSPLDLIQIQARIKSLPLRPVISFVLPLENPSATSLRNTIESARAQLYANWELCIISHNFDNMDVRELLDSYANADLRIKVIPAFVGDSLLVANAALAATTGDLIGFLDQGDQLSSHALYMIAEEINSHVDASLIYTDEDLIDENGRRSSPQFKTDWNPDLFLSQNYLGRLTVYRRNLIAPTGFRVGFNGCEEYDLALRVSEQVAPATIRHIPYVLLHRSMPTAEVFGMPDVAATSRRVLQDHFARNGIRAIVETSNSGNYCRVRRLLPDAPPRVSIIIPTRDRVELLRGVIESILERTIYPNYEIVIVDNQSVEAETISYLKLLGESRQIRVLRFDHPFNHSAINNFAAAHCQSPMLAFLNNDLFIFNGQWLTEMVSHAVRPEVGAVGAKLYYPNGLIQHAGILLGINGVAANCYSGYAPNSSGYFCRAELVQNYSAVSAACLVTRAEVFAKVGGFNESDLPAAFNDVDYCLRLRGLGLLITWTPYAELYHLESMSRGDDMSPGKVKRFRQHQTYIAMRWGRLLSNDPYYSPNLSLDELPFMLAASSRVRRPWKFEGQSDG